MMTARLGAPSASSLLSLPAPRFSVVCPAYRAERTIASTIASVRAQTFGDWEMIVVDDGSGDSTAEVAEVASGGDPRITIVAQENAGTAAARNTGVGGTTGRYVALIDNDDVWLPGYLERVAAGFDAEPSAGLAFADAWTFSDRLDRVHRLTTLEDLPAVPHSLSAEELLLALLRINFVTASAASVKREALLSAGPFEPALSGSDDWDMWLRVAAAGFGGVRAGDSPLVVLRESSTSQSKDLLKMLSTAELTAERARERAEPGSPAHAAAQAYVDGLQPQLARLRDPSPAARFSRRLRPSLLAARDRVTERRTWRPPPEEVRRAMEPERA